MKLDTARDSEISSWPNRDNDGKKILFFASRVCLRDWPRILRREFFRQIRFRFLSLLITLSSTTRWANSKYWTARFLLLHYPVAFKNFCFREKLICIPKHDTVARKMCDDTSNELWLICHQIPHIFGFIIRTKTPHRKIPFDTEIFCAKARRSAVFCLENDLCVDVILISIKAHSTICEKDT